MSCVYKCVLASLLDCIEWLPSQTVWPYHHDPPSHCSLDKTPMWNARLSDESLVYKKVWKRVCLFDVTNYESLTRGWALEWLDRVHNSHRPLDRLQYVFATLILTSTSFPVPSLNTLESFVFELSCGQTNRQTFTQNYTHTDRRTWTPYSRDYHWRE